MVVNMLVCHAYMKEDLVYDVVKALFEFKPELEAVHGAAKNLKLEAQTKEGSPIPFHPGSIRYFTEKKVKME